MVILGETQMPGSYVCGVTVVTDTCQQVIEYSQVH